MAKRKSKKLRPRPMCCWAIVDIETRSIKGVYERQRKRYVAGDCFDGQTVVRVRVIPYVK
jgi:hypothetical protein